MRRSRTIFVAGARAEKVEVGLLGVLLVLGAGTASAQVKLFPDQCEAALTIAESIEQKHDISPRLKASFERFRRSDCDVDTSFERDSQTDVIAFGEFKMRFEMWRTCTDNPLSRVCSINAQ
jgi:hypothetical protein